MKDIKKPITIFLKIIFIPAAIKIMFNKTSKNSPSPDTKFIRTGIEKNRNKLIG
ncbi:MAG: hypothetical protein WCL18_07370 [bacterium]